MRRSDTEKPVPPTAGSSAGAGEGARFKAGCPTCRVHHAVSDGLAAALWAGAAKDDADPRHGYQRVSTAAGRTDSSHLTLFCNQTRFGPCLDQVRTKQVRRCGRDSAGTRVVL